MKKKNVNNYGHKDELRNFLSGFSTLITNITRLSVGDDNDLKRIMSAIEKKCILIEKNRTLASDYKNKIEELVKIKNEAQGEIQVLENKKQRISFLDNDVMKMEYDDIDALINIKTGKIAKIEAKILSTKEKINIAQENIRIATNELNVLEKERYLKEETLYRSAEMAKLLNSLFGKVNTSIEEILDKKFVSNYIPYGYKIENLRSIPINGNVGDDFSVVTGSILDIPMEDEDYTELTEPEMLSPNEKTPDYLHEINSILADNKNFHYASVLYDAEKEPLLYDTEKSPILYDTEYEELLYDNEKGGVLYDSEIDDILYDNEVSEPTYDIEKEDILYDTEREPLLYDAEKEPLLYDTEKSPILYDTEYEELLYDNEKGGVLYDSEIDDILYDNEKEPLLYDTEKSPILYDTECEELLYDNEKDASSYEIPDYNEFDEKSDYNPDVEVEETSELDDENTNDLNINVQNDTNYLEDMLIPIKEEYFDEIAEEDSSTDVDVKLADDENIKADYKALLEDVFDGEEVSYKDFDVDIQEKMIENAEGVIKNVVVLKKHHVPLSITLNQTDIYFNINSEDLDDLLDIITSDEDDNGMGYSLEFVYYILNELANTDVDALIDTYNNELENIDSKSGIIELLKKAGNTGKFELNRNANIEKLKTLGIKNLNEIVNEFPYFVDLDNPLFVSLINTFDKEDLVFKMNSDKSIIPKIYEYWKNN